MRKDKIGDRDDIFQDFVNSADFDVHEACEFMWGGKKIYDTVMQTSKQLLDDPVVMNKSFRTDFARGEVAGYGYMKLRRIIDLGKEGKVPTLNWSNYTMFTYLAGGLISSSAHHGMFESVCLNLGNDEQAKKYVKEAQEYKIFG